MSTFSLAIPQTLHNEGGFFHNLSTGEAVNFGITHYFLRSIKPPNFPPYSGPPASIWKAPASADEVSFIRSISIDQATAWYQQYYWNPLRLDQILYQPLANHIFDLAVNTGLIQSVLILQRAINTLHWPGAQIKEDGTIGPATISAANSTTPPLLLLQEFGRQAESFYRKLVIKDPNKSAFLPGWLWRLPKQSELHPEPPELPS